MQHSEALMATMMDGFDLLKAFSGTHLIVEAGALPFSALFSSITRIDGDVIITNSDQQAHSIAADLIQKLEKLAVLQTGKVKAICIDPLSAEFAQQDFASPYMATITQCVDGADNVRKIMKTLIDDHKIDPIITRDADGLVQLLYEPICPKKMHGIAPQKLQTIPTHTDAENEEPSHLFPRRMCYNTSRLFSRNLERRTDIKSSDYEHMFRSPENPRSTGL